MCGQKNGGGPAPEDFTPAEELALSLNRGRPATEGIEGGVTSDPSGGSSSQSSCFVQGDSDTLAVTLLPPPKQTFPSTEVTANSTSYHIIHLWLLMIPSPNKTFVIMDVGGAWADTVRALYKRQLEEDIACKALQEKVLQLQIKKLTLEVEKLEYDKQPVGVVAAQRFNRHHARARSVMERAFGMMITRLRAIFLKALEIHNTFVPQVITACAILHNICLGASDTMALEDDVQGGMPEDELEDRLEAVSGALWRDQLSVEVSVLEEVDHDHDYL
ncbi:putative nuclease HARBI1 [Xyrichtys novacula]|nr:putative nuclease HARBI1 [Xyrichtys novacula]